MQQTISQSVGAPRRVGTQSRRRPSSRHTAVTYRHADRAIRTLTSVAIAALVLSALVVGALSVGVRREPPAPAGWTTVSVDPNGSLWQLAQTHPVGGLDTAATVELIRAENGLESSVLLVGQTLRVPGSTVSATAVALR